MSPALSTLSPPLTTTGLKASPAHNSPSDGFGTRAIHVASEPDPHTGAVIPSISLATTYAQSAPGVHKGFEYSRSDNPNRNALEQVLSSIEVGGVQALGFASGSAATGVVVQSLGAGAHVVSVNDVYGGTHRYLKRVASEIQGLEVSFVDLENADEQAVLGAIRPNTKLIWLESPTNPTLKLIDVAAIARIARSHPSRPFLLVDNTFLSPYYSSPLTLGADAVLHSLTKYVNGHSDVVMGAVILPESSTVDSNPAVQAKHAEWASKLRFLQNATGAVPSPYDSWMVQRGLKTLHLRMRQHGSNALKVARALKHSSLTTLSGEPLIKEVHYPGLEGDRRYDLAWRSLSGHAKKWIVQEVLPRSEGSSSPKHLNGSPTTPVDSVPGTPIEGSTEPVPVPANGFPFSGMISFTLPTYNHAVRFLQSTRLFTLAESLGGVESLAEHPASMTHAGIPEAEREALGISAGLVRLSVGIEEADDLVEDIKFALAKIASEL